MSQLPQTPRKISRAEAVSKLWRIPNLTYKLHTTQLDMYNKVHSSEDKIMVVACARGWGKSYALLTIAIETCLKKPNAIVKYLAPTAKDLKNIVLPNFRQILEDCPKDIRETIKYKPQEGKIIFESNGSEIHLAGTEKGNAEKIRGVSADLCIVDEAGFCDDLDYIIKSILFPTITRGTGTRGKKIIMASTPSKTNDHHFIKYMRDHEFKNKLIKYTVYDNPRLKLEADENGYATVEGYVENIIAAQYVDGINSTAFQREYLGEIVTEDNDAVVPEFKKELQNKIIKEWPTPSHYDGYVAMDIGFKDLNFVIFSYYDFQAAKLIIKDELVLSGAKMLTDNLAYEIKLKEALIYYNKTTGEVMKPYLRVADNNNPILLQDLAVKHGITFMPTAKDNFEAALNNFRMMLKSEKIIIDPKCEQLISHLKGAVWNKARTSFARSPDKGHYDGCFIDSTNVLTREGYKKISEIKAGDEVLTHNNRFRKVNCVMKRPYEGDLIQIKPIGREEIKCTPDHAFYVAETYKCRKDGFTGQTQLKDPTWICAENLEKHRLYIPNIEESSKINITKEMCFLYGYYVAEGSVGGNGHQVHFAGHQKEVNVSAIIEKAVKETYGLGKPGTSRRSKRRHKTGEFKPRTAKIRTWNRPNSKARTMCITQSELRTDLMLLGKSVDKHFPSWIVDLNKEQAHYMLLGYLFGDGHFGKQGIKFSTISKKIKEGADVLSRIIGITPNYLYNKKNKIAYFGRDIPSISKPFYTGSFDLEQSIKLVEYIHNTPDLKFAFEDKLVHKMILKNIRNFSKSFINYEKKTIKNQNCFVYNLEVDEDNSYTANGVAVHNCAAITYLCRNLNLSKNPYPSDGYKANYYYSNNYDGQPKTEFEKNLKDIFTPKVRRRR